MDIDAALHCSSDTEIDNAQDDNAMRDPLTVFFQKMSGHGLAAAAAAAESDGVHYGNAIQQQQQMYTSEEMQHLMQEAKQHVLEDVERFRDNWRRNKLPDMKAGAADIWRQ